MHLPIRRATSCAAIALSCLIAGQAYGTASRVLPAGSKAKLALAALAAQRDTDPALNGSISSHADQRVTATMQLAAEAARRDLDPSANGAIGTQGMAGLAPELKPADSPTLDEAWVAYENCHWREAFETFATLADAGDLEAARMALSMVRHGSALYRQTFEISTERLSSWRRLGRVLATAIGRSSGDAMPEPRR
jgi:hypothetical protein